MSCSKLQQQSLLLNRKLLRLTLNQYPLQLQQIDFLAELLEKLHGEGIHTAVDTAGFQPWERFEKILPNTDLFLYDIKAADSDVHKKLTGVTNELILENLKKLQALGKRIWIRIPYIPGRNSGEMDGKED